MQRCNKVPGAIDGANHSGPERGGTSPTLVTRVALDLSVPILSSLDFGVLNSPIGSVVQTYSLPHSVVLLES